MNGMAAVISFQKNNIYKFLPIFNPFKIEREKKRAFLIINPNFNFMNIKTKKEYQIIQKFTRIFAMIYLNSFFFNILTKMPHLPRIY